MCKDNKAELRLKQIEYYRPYHGCTVLIDFNSNSNLAAIFTCIFNSTKFDSPSKQIIHENQWFFKNKETTNLEEIRYLSNDPQYLLDRLHSQKIALISSEPIAK